MPVFDTVQHGAHRTDFSLSDRPGALNVHDDAVVSVDEVIGRIAKECRAFTGCCPLACGIRMGGELGFHLRCRTKGCIVQYVQILLHCARRIAWIDDAVIPIYLWRRVLFVRISLNQASVCREALPTDQTI